VLTLLAEGDFASWHSVRLIHSLLCFRGFDSFKNVFLSNTIASQYGRGVVDLVLPLWAAFGQTTTQAGRSKVDIGVGDLNSEIGQ
jgi:hypothetical protein